MRRRMFVLAAVAAASVPAARAKESAAKLPPVQVYKSPTCGCCGAWVDHMKAAGFKVQVTEVDDTAVVRRRAGLPDRYGSCHTAFVGGYAVEGHVPAADVKRLLAQKPQALGIAVPGMPLGSPGMEQGPRKDPYAVLLVARDGSASVFAKYD